jgi:hypothetical protein
VQDGRIHIEVVNDAFLAAGGSPAEWRAGIEYAIVKGWLWRHESGSWAKFMPSEIQGGPEYAYAKPPQGEVTGARGRALGVSKT